MGGLPSRKVIANIILRPLHNYKCVDCFVALLLAIDLVLQQKSIASEANYVFRYFFGLYRGLIFENLDSLYVF